MATHYVDSAHREPTMPPGGYIYAPPRDVLTGEPIRPDTIHKRVSDDRVDSRPTRVAHRDGWRADITARPLRLHTVEVETTSHADGASATDGKGSLGGHAYSAPFQKYLASGERVDSAEERADLWVWYRSVYGRGRVKAALTARYGPRDGYLAYLAAWAYASGDMDVERIANEARHSVAWVVRMAKIAREAASVHGDAQTARQEMSAQTSA